jgi:hypothetical protein
MFMEDVDLSEEKTHDRLRILKSKGLAQILIFLKITFLVKNDIINDVLDFGINAVF